MNQEVQKAMQKLAEEKRFYELRQRLNSAEKEIERLTTMILVNGQMIQRCASEILKLQVVQRASKEGSGGGEDEDSKPKDSEETPLDTGDHEFRIFEVDPTILRIITRFESLLQSVSFPHSLVTLLFLYTTSLE